MNNVVVKQIIFVMTTFVICIKSLKLNGTIYILEWTTIFKEPFSYLGKGHAPFNGRNCSFQNCFLTDEHSYFKNVLEFDALLFNAYNLRRDVELPSVRTAEQVYLR